MRIIRNQDGTTAVEFAIVAPVLMLFIFGILECSVMMYAQSVLEGATSISSRLGKTGYIAENRSRTQTIRDALTEHGSLLFNPDYVTITAKSYAKFDAIAEPEPYTDSNHNHVYNLGEPYSDINGNGQWDEDMGRAGYGNANEIVAYTVTYPWRMRTPIIGRFFGTGGIINLSATSVVKNEPY